MSVRPSLPLDGADLRPSGQDGDDGRVVAIDPPRPHSAGHCPAAGVAGLQGATTRGIDTVAPDLGHHRDTTAEDSLLDEPGAEPRAASKESPRHRVSAVLSPNISTAVCGLGGLDGLDGPAGAGDGAGAGAGAGAAASVPDPVASTTVMLTAATATGAPTQARHCPKRAPRRIGRSTR